MDQQQGQQQQQVDGGGPSSSWRNATEQQSAGPAAPAAPAAPAPASMPPPSFAPKRNRGNLRKRAPDEEGGQQGGGGASTSDAAGPTHVVRQAKAARGEPLAFSNKQEGAEEVHVTYESTRAIQAGKDARATGYLETETDTSHDARALREAVLRQATENPGQPVDDSKYKGMNNYIDYRAGFRSEHSVASEKGRGTHGPLRASMYVRSTSIMDYNPSICKDYKETGFCSYGDSCKFMHDRGDYKMSWELDRDWEEEQKQKVEAKMRAMQRRGGKGSDEEDDEEAAEEEEDDDLPFACYICRLPWGEAKSPVVTRCKHYFCESCALKHNAKTSKCAVCEQPTMGIFNVAHDIEKKQKKKGRG